MGYTNSISTMKLWYQHTKQHTYFSTEIFDEYNNTFGKSWSPGSKILKDRETPDLPAIKLDLFDYPSIKDHIYEAIVHFTQR